MLLFGVHFLFSHCAFFLSYAVSFQPLFAGTCIKFILHYNILLFAFCIYCSRRETVLELIVDWCTLCVGSECIRNIVRSSVRTVRYDPVCKDDHQLRTETGSYNAVLKSDSSMSHDYLVRKLQILFCCNVKYFLKTCGLFQVQPCSYVNVTSIWRWLNSIAHFT